jgi:hypothetical protein
MNVPFEDDDEPVNEALVQSVERLMAGMPLAVLENIMELWGHEDPKASALGFRTYVSRKNN